MRMPSKKLQLYIIHTSIDDSAERHPATKFSVFFTKTLVRQKASTFPTPIMKMKTLKK